MLVKQNKTYVDITSVKCDRFFYTKPLIYVESNHQLQSPVTCFDQTKVQNPKSSNGSQRYPNFYLTFLYWFL